MTSQRRICHGNDEEQQKAFDMLKESFCREPILKVYDLELPTRVEVDASGFAMG